jgi:hypothetical protein
MKDIFEIRKAGQSDLLFRAKRRIGNFPNLTEIYDDSFLTELVRHKNDYENLLLFWLVADAPFTTPIALDLFKDIEDNLNLFHAKDDISIFKAKLRQWNAIAFEGAITELEFAAEYLKRGYQIKLEPALPNARKGDFSARKGRMKIYFEAKMIYKEVSGKTQFIINELSDRFSRMEEHLIISIDIKEKFEPSQTARVSRFIRQKLREIEQTSLETPYSFSYPESDPIITVDVLSRVPDNENGLLTGFTFGGGIKGDWSDLRRKIASAVSQLHPNHAGVVIVEPYRLDASQYDIENALFGDLKVNFSGEPRLFRGGDRIFAKDKNNRLSAVIYYKKTLHELRYSKEKLVYQNNFAAVKLPADVFAGMNVINTN